MAATINKCKCENSFQDVKYGTGNRVHSESEKGPKCSVCGTRNDSGSSGYKKRK